MYIYIYIHTYICIYYYCASGLRRAFRHVFSLARIVFDAACIARRDPSETQRNAVRDRHVGSDLPFANPVILPRLVSNLLAEKKKEEEAARLKQEEEAGPQRKTENI